MVVFHLMLRTTLSLYLSLSLSLDFVLSFVSLFLFFLSFLLHASVCLSVCPHHPSLISLYRHVVITTVLCNMPRKHCANDTVLHSVIFWPSCVPSTILHTQHISLTKTDSFTSEEIPQCKHNLYHPATPSLELWINNKQTNNKQNIFTIFICPTIPYYISLPDCPLVGNSWHI